MKLIIGLGNPGPQYDQTRHNIGAMAIERLSHELGTEPAVWREEKNYQALLCKIGDVLLVKQLTFMNTAGISVKRIAYFYKITPEDIWVVHDDIDLPLGKIRIRFGGASAGHHGVDSIITNLKTDKFLRFRLGIGRGKQSTGREMDKNIHRRAIISFVLSRFRTNEAGKMKHLVKSGAEALRIALTEGIDKAMNRFN